MCKKCWKKKANCSLNQGSPGLTPYVLTTQALPPLLPSVLGFLSLIRPIVEIVKTIDLYQKIL